MLAFTSSIHLVRTLPRRLRAAAGLAALLTGACGGGGSDGATTPTTPVTPVTPVTPASPTDVVVTNNSFTPGSLTVAPGTTVTWTWATCSGGNDPYGYGTGETCVDHNVTWDAADAASSVTQGKGTYQRQFATAGTYKYHCAIHGAAMSGTVLVQ